MPSQSRMAAAFVSLDPILQTRLLASKAKSFPYDKKLGSRSGHENKHREGRADNAQHVVYRADNYLPEINQVMARQIPGVSPTRTKDPWSKRRQPPTRRNNNQLPRSPMAIAKYFTQKIKETTNVKDAVAILDEMKRKEIPRDAFHFSAVISRCGRFRDWQKALTLVEEMRIDNIIPNEFTYSAAISACEKGRQYEKALELLAQMERDDISPDVITYNALISACHKAGKWEKALELLKEMKHKGMKRDVVTFSAAVSACEKSGNWEKALDLLEIMKEEKVKPNVFTYSAAISACEKGSQWEKALHLLKGMKKLRIEPDIITYRVILAACFKAKQYPIAIKFVKPVCREKIVPDASVKEIDRYNLDGLGLPDSCMLVALTLLKASEFYVNTCSIDQKSLVIKNLVFETGKHLSKSPANSPAMKTLITKFLREVSGPQTANVKDKKNHMLVTSTALKEWAASKKYDRFVNLITGRVRLVQ
eukprot:scaffold1170_cov174-Amphora_coffeaeformis.AAC.21